MPADVNETESFSPNGRAFPSSSTEVSFTLMVSPSFTDSGCGSRARPFPSTTAAATAGSRLTSATAIASASSSTRFPSVPRNARSVTVSGCRFPSLSGGLMVIVCDAETPGMLSLPILTPSRLAASRL